MRTADKFWVGLAIGLAVLGTLIFLASTHLHWLAIHSGSAVPKNGTYDYYYAWSGWLGDIGQLTLPFTTAGVAYAFYRAHECNHHPCHRIASHNTANGHKLCRRCISKPSCDLDYRKHEIHPDHLENGQHYDRNGERERIENHERIGGL